METNYKMSKDIKKTSRSRKAILISYIYNNFRIAILFFLLIGYSSTSFLNGQVTTRCLKDRSNIGVIIDNHYAKNPIANIIVKPNIQATLDEDERLGKTISRFSVKTPTTLTQKDGVFYKNANTTNWKLVVHSPGATTLNFKFSNLVIPKGAQMYLYSKDEKMIMGPIIDKNIHNGIFASDIIYGDEVIIEIIFHNKYKFDKFSISVDYIGYGIKPLYYGDVQNRSFGDSKWCNNDVNCLGDTWQDDWSDVQDGVALVLIDGDGTCSGSLIKGNCNTGRPFFLTALHCGANSLSNNNFSSWVFRFNYEIKDCDNPETEPHYTQWISFTGCIHRSHWVETDFFLVELEEDVEDISFNEISYGAINDNDPVACIHHPKGDVKKISVDDHYLYVSNIYWWVVNNWDDGITELGSSGAPLFDGNHKIIGQLSYTSEFQGSDCYPDGGSSLINDHFGRIDESWIGGGTPTTSLSYWLTMPLIEIVVNSPNCNLDNGTATVSVTCGQEPLTYLWSTGETTATIENLSSGSLYGVTITDGANNTFEEEVYIESEVIVEATNPLWSDVISQYNLDPIELQNRSIYIEDELILDSDYTFSNVTFGFAPGGKMTIKAGNNVEIIDLDGIKSILKACDGIWRGITVQGNSILTMKNSEILDASIGISAISGSTIELSGIDIIGNDGRIAVSLNGAVNLTHFGGIIIQNYTYGVYGSDNNGYYNFGFTNISNTDFGFYLLNSPSTIGESTINTTNIGIYLDKCPGSIVVSTDIYSYQYGLLGYNSNNLRVDRTSIGSSASSGKIGIELNNCSYSDIFDFEHIYASDFGIKVFQSYGVKLLGINLLKVSGLANTSCGGVQLTNGVDCEVKGITIDANQCSFGIESIEGFANRILENDVSLFSSSPIRTANIRTLSSEYETINENKINGLASVKGIYSHNSPGNTYLCNEIANTTDGLLVSKNSEGQDIWGNKFLSCYVDLSISSRIGVHYFKGNEFHNGSADAISLNDQDIYYSRFHVNKIISHHMPTDPDPEEGWFRNYPNVWTYFDDCKDESGKGKFYSDETELSSYFEYIKSLQLSMPEVYFVKLFHLLKYENARDSFELPTYIKQDTVFSELCGLLELVDVTTQLSSLSMHSEESSISEENIMEIRTLQQQYILATDDSVKQSIMSDLRLLMTSMKPKFDAEFLADSLAYDNLKYELETINCTDVLVQKWKDIYIKYIDFIQTGEVTPKHQSSLIVHSQNCSDKYGDAIHLARALTNTFDLTYYDLYDGCLTEPIEPRSNKINILKALVQPNPTKGTIVISTEKPITGIVNVFDLSGRIVFSENIKKVNQHTLDLKLADGIYLINIISDSGEKHSEKIVVAR